MTNNPGSVDILGGAGPVLVAIGELGYDTAGTCKNTMETMLIYTS